MTSTVRTLRSRLSTAVIAGAAMALVAGTVSATTSTAHAAEVLSIAEIQGTGDATEYADQTVTTRGVVTAAYPKGGFSGYYLQTPGTGGDPGKRDASDAIFVYAGDQAVDVAIGDHVEVTGKATEYSGLTEIEQNSATVLDEPAEAVKPTELEYPRTDVKREAYEGMLVAPQGDYTVTDNYNTNFYGEFSLAAGTEPLPQPTDVARPGSDRAEQIEADNAAREVGLDDGASIDYGEGDARDTRLPYLHSPKEQVRVGAPVTFASPVILDYRHDGWRFQPTEQLTAENDESVSPVTFGETREQQPAHVGGSVRLASFNVLNYFPTTGDRLDGCAYYRDREGNPITVKDGCDARGAANQQNLERQQVKIVKAINKLDADIVTLEEIENSAAFGKDRDAALATLTEELNAAAGEKRWSYVASPQQLPDSEDVIRTAMIYRKAKVRAIGQSAIHDVSAFSNARQPLAQTFRERGGARDDTFVVIANHFKSKGGDGSGDNADTGDGQGAFNGDRVRQAKALVRFANQQSTRAKTPSVFLTGDFNAYAEEDPMQVFADAGYVNVSATRADGSTYVYDGRVGSLDHVLASPTAAEGVAGADIWNINSPEPVAYEYSRYNYNATNLYDESVFRSSDHDPIVVGFDPDARLVDVNLVNINDFHGRIEKDSTVQFAGTVERLREQGGADNTLFLSAGDNIGASLFESAVADDQPTIDVLDALELRTSAVGNHEFDKGFADLRDRVIGDDEPNADWSYLGANVYEKGTKEPVLDEYDVLEVDGVRVAVIGTVTQETPSLVTPDGIKNIEFGNPVAAVNRVAKDIEAEDAADVIVAEYHEGAGAGTPEGSTLAEQVEAGGAFARIVEKTSPSVDAVFTGHTHMQYAWDAPVPGQPGKTRPIVQTGSYGEHLGQVELTVDAYTGDVAAYSARNVTRTETDPQKLIDRYDRVAEVDRIVGKAMEDAAEVGNQEVGTIEGDITTAYQGGERDDRASESTLGNLVANSLRDTLKSKARGGAEIGVANPGGLRAELMHKASGPESEPGIVRYAEANAVLPFTNNLHTITLTGRQFKTLLEQQWQTGAGGETPERPYLQLGLSDNVSYTYKKKAKQGNHITSITVNGKPIKPKRGYRIATFSFLTSGGDNFHVFTKGKNVRDSGLVDRDGWIDYLEKNSPLSPNYARRSVQAAGLPKKIRRGKRVSFTLRKLDLTSLGSPANNKAIVRVGKQRVVTTKVRKGTAKIAFRVPKKARGKQISVRVQPSATLVRFPVKVRG